METQKSAGWEDVWFANVVTGVTVETMVKVVVWVMTEVLENVWRMR